MESIAMNARIWPLSCNRRRHVPELDLRPVSLTYAAWLIIPH